MEANQVYYMRGEKVYFWDYDEKTLKEGIVEEYFRRDGGWVAIAGLHECLKVNKVSKDKDTLLETLCKKHEKEIKNLGKWVTRHTNYLNDIKAYMEKENN